MAQKPTSQEIQTQLASLKKTQAADLAWLREMEDEMKIRNQRVFNFYRNERDLEQQLAAALLFEKDMLLPKVRVICNFAGFDKEVHYVLRSVTPKQIRLSRPGVPNINIFNKEGKDGSKNGWNSIHPEDLAKILNG